MKKILFLFLSLIFFGFNIFSMESGSSDQGQNQKNINNINNNGSSINDFLDIFAAQEIKHNVHQKKQDKFDFFSLEDFICVLTMPEKLDTKTIFGYYNKLSSDDKIVAQEYLKLFGNNEVLKQIEKKLEKLKKIEEINLAEGFISSKNFEDFSKTPKEVDLDYYLSVFNFGFQDNCENNKNLQAFLVYFYSDILKEGGDKCLEVTAYLYDQLDQDSKNKFKEAYKFIDVSHGMPMQDILEEVERQNKINNNIKYSKTE